MKTYEKEVQKAAKTLDEFIEITAKECESEEVLETIVKGALGAEKVKTASLLMAALVAVLYDKDPNQVSDDMVAASPKASEAEVIMERMGVCYA